jgi:hypothetical protein
MKISGLTIQPNQIDLSIPGKNFQFNQNSQADLGSGNYCRVNFDQKNVIFHTTDNSNDMGMAMSGCIQSGWTIMFE